MSKAPTAVARLRPTPRMLVQLDEVALREIVIDVVAEALESIQPRALPKRLTQAELAEVWQVSERTLYSLRADGLPVIWIGESPRFDLAACEEWAKARGAARG